MLIIDYYYNNNFIHNTDDGSFEIIIQCSQKNVPGLKNHIFIMKKDTSTSTLPIVLLFWKMYACSMCPLLSMT